MIFVGTLRLSRSVATVAFATATSNVAREVADVLILVFSFFHLVSSALLLVSLLYRFVFSVSSRL